MYSFTIRRFLITILLVVILVWVLSYPRPSAIWSADKLAAAINEGKINTITVHAVGVTAQTDDEAVLILLRGGSLSHLRHELVKSGVSEDQLALLDIEFVLISLTAPVLPILAILLVAGLSALSRQRRV